jgi:hypothetical protein
MNKKLLNEIGDTPAGQRALKRLRIFRTHEAESAKTGEAIEKKFGTPEKAGEYAKEYEDKQRIINMIKKRMGEPVNEGVLSNLATKARTAVVGAAQQVGKKIVKGIENLPSNKALIGGLLDAGSTIAQGVQRERTMPASRQTEHGMRTLGSATDTVAKKLKADKRRRNAFGNP